MQKPRNNAEDKETMQEAKKQCRRQRNNNDCHLAGKQPRRGDRE